MSDTGASDPFAPQHCDWRAAAGVEGISADVDAHFALMDMLVDLRKRRHTMREVAQDMGVSEAQVADLESEDSNPTLSSLQSYARAVGVRVHFLVESPTWRREEL